MSDEKSTEEKLSAALDTIDLMRDEFLRIKSVASQFKDFSDRSYLGSEIIGLCERAIKRTDRNVPLVVELEKTKERLQEVEAGLRGLQAVAQNLVDELIKTGF